MSTMSFYFDPVSILKVWGKTCEEKPSSYNSTPIPLSAIKYGRVPFTPSHFLERLMFYEGLIILTFGCFAIEV